MKFSGLIGHSFALRLPSASRSAAFGIGNRPRVEERFALADGDGEEFVVRDVIELDAVGGNETTSHSPLAKWETLSVGPLPLQYLTDREVEGQKAFSWAFKGSKADRDRSAAPRMIFSNPEAEEEGSAINDFLVATRSEHEARKPPPISQILLELVAHKRSRLFGLCLAERFVNVMLPHVKLSPAAGNDGAGAGGWWLQPLVTFIRDGHDHDCFRRTYSLTLFLLPVELPGLTDREVSLEQEIAPMVNAGWGLATARDLPTPPIFDLEGPLCDYLPRLTASDLAQVEHPTLRTREQTLRQVTEVLAFHVAVAAANGAYERADERIFKLVGNDVITALGSARVSSALVVDRHLKPKDVNRPLDKTGPPGVLPELMKTLAGESRVPNQWTKKEHRHWRIDRPLVDSETYAVGVLPHKRSLLVASAGSAQHGTRESGLMQAGTVAYMTIGAATAIGTMRAIDRDLEGVESESPRRIAEIDGEIATDLHEIYDLDITRESFRQLYRRLRLRLGVVRDYETLQSKMSALYRATSTKHELKSQRQIAWLTAGIVLLSVLILVGTVIVAVKG